MKKIFFAIFFISGLTVFAQSDKVVGDYFVDFGNEQHQIEYRLTLNLDGTFLFHSFNNNKKGNPPIVNTYGKGTWSLDEKVVSFLTDENLDLDKNQSLDFNGTKARFISKPERDKTDRVIKTRLQFFDSKIFWVKGLEIFKK
ncbi:hypothetical protein [Flagellimonas sp. GZD32]|uniref:hypothetical protein n=1 Tax=Flagellimonas cixiensis TaxID=3228750 RepID=UPI0035C915EC